ncbi:hypothetical protein [Phenylobacterium sp.]|uniref:hypothetical protein n=1 Tax=Phenylobacterium sp. TaxID=1871053 RepID=UPI003D2C7F4F
MEIVISDGGIDWPAWVQAVGSVVAILFAAGIALFQHWSAHDVHKASARTRIDRIAQLCDLIVVEATIIKKEATDDAGQKFDLFDWAHMRTDRARLEPYVNALTGLDLLSLPSNEAMAAVAELARGLRDLISAAEALANGAKDHVEDIDFRRMAVATECDLVETLADTLKAALS